MTIQPQRFKMIFYHYLNRLRRNRRANAQAGFTLTEVLVAILLTTTFVAVAMQGMVVAMLLKSKALQTAEATRWVQTDLESIRSKITLTQIPLAANQLRCHPASIDRGFADLIRDNLAGGDITGTADYQLPALTETSKMGKTFQVARTLSIPPTAENTDAKMLGIQYIVSPTNGTNLEQPILHFYTEVMPDAALQCQ
jgi:prepilin-type N-terminal cleavage/methylation domain-containing protein